MTATRLHLMRHCAPAVEGRLLGHGDVPATAAGIAACAAAARGLDVAQIVTSDLVRARACAAAIGSARVDARWRELDFGAWDGCDPAAVDAGALAAFHADPDACPPPGGERWSDLTARVAAAIAALDPGPVLVVTHAGAMRAALAVLCGLSVRATWALRLPYAAVVDLDVWAGPPAFAQVTGLRG